MGSIEVADWQHAKTLINQLVAFTVTFSKISTMEVAIWVKAVARVYNSCFH